MELLDVPFRVCLVFPVRDTVHSPACVLPQTFERALQRLRREQMSDGEKLPLPVPLGQFGYAVEFR